MDDRWHLSPDRCFDPDPTRRALARTLYQQVQDLPIVSPHGHVDPALFVDPGAVWGTPVDLLIIPDHYVFRMLYSQGVPLEELGIPPRDGTPPEQDHRRIWQRFADHFYLFAGTPTGLWLADVLNRVFGVSEKLTSGSAQRVYDQIAAQLAQPDYTPQALFQRFAIEDLCTTDPATAPLEYHAALHAHEWGQRIRPTFRPDAVIDLQLPDWHSHIARLGELAGIEIIDYRSYILALETRRAFFMRYGCTATDHAVQTPYTQALSLNEAETLFQRALLGTAGDGDAARLTAHMLVELARMSSEDGLVMQIHAGSYRNHNSLLYARFGPDKGADIPVRTEWTRNLHALLNAYGNHPRFRLILFTLDESTYSRELAPLAGHYPALLLGPPWWFFDSVHGMRRFLDHVVETAGIYNFAGFNDDTRAFCSIPARHDVWRRVSCAWLAGQVAQDLIDMEDAERLAHACAYGLAKHAYRLE